MKANKWYSFNSLSTMNVEYLERFIPNSWKEYIIPSIANV